jgi:hypothetical protein
MKLIVAEAQDVLNRAYGLDLQVDGKAGPRTAAAVDAVLRETGGVPASWDANRRLAFATQVALRKLGAYHGSLDGLWGPASLFAMQDFLDGPDAAFDRPEPARLPKGTRWPTYSSERAMTDFFGPPATHRCRAGKVALPMPFRLAWDLDDTVSSFSCHELVAEPLTRIYGAAFEHYGEARFRELRLDVWGGCFNDRKMRGGSKTSTHAWAIAVDHDPENNQLRWGRDRASLAGREYEAFWKAVEAEGAVSLGRAANYDWMHFQFCVPG